MKNISREEATKLTRELQEGREEGYREEKIKEER
jgi:hypothetical protein